MEKTTPVVVAPTIPYGMSEHHMSLSGTITLDYATMYAVIRCVVTSAVRHGFKRIFVLNGHGGTTTALQNMIGELPNPSPSSWKNRRRCCMPARPRRRWSWRWRPNW